MTDLRVDESLDASEAVVESAPDAPIVRHRTLKRLARNRFALAAAAFIVLLVVVAIAAPVLAPFDPDRQTLLDRYQGPSGDHWLGTDALGRDILSRIIYGTRISLLAGAIALSVSVALGVPFGLISGFVGGRIDKLFNLVSDALMSVPPLVLALALIAVLGPGLTNAMLVIGIVVSPRFFRLTRVATKDLRHETFVEGSTAIGCSTRRVVLVHILPNAIPPLIVQATFVFGSAILAEASLSFLGLGVRPPTASWGSMLSEASDRLDLTYLIWGPGVMLTVTVLAFAALGDGWRDAIGLDRAELAE